MNRAAMSGRSLSSILSGGPKSFYGPARRGQIEPTMRNMSAKTLAERYRQIDEAVAGSNLIKGATDQGSAGDPNYIRGGVGTNINRERFNDWGGFRGVEYSRQWREAQQAKVRASASTDRIDYGLNYPSIMQNPTGTVHVNVNSNGTAAKTSASADGIFGETTIRNSKQMNPTVDGASPPISY
jgi:hypothetical protein